MGVTARCSGHWVKALRSSRYRFRANACAHSSLKILLQEKI